MSFQGVLCFDMVFAGSLHLLAVIGAAQIAGAALATIHLPETPSDAPGIVEPAARKGTRSYTSDGAAGAAPAAPADAASQAQPAADALELCMSTWDAGTHISKSRWRDICKRQLQEDTTKTPYGGDVKPAR